MDYWTLRLHIVRDLAAVAKDRDEAALADNMPRFGDLLTAFQRCIEHTGGWGRLGLRSPLEREGDEAKPYGPEKVNADIRVAIGRVARHELTPEQAADELIALYDLRKQKG